MTPDERLLRRAVIASVTLHLAAAAVPGSWWRTVARIEDIPPSRRAAVEITLVSGSLGGDLPPLETPVETPAPPAERPPTAPSPPEPPRAEGPAAPALPDLRELTAPGSGVARRPNPGGGGAAASGEGENQYVPPRLLAGALPIDPRESEALHVPSEIPVRLRVGVDGRVIEVVPEIDDLPPAVIAALRRSASTMRFIPARRGGRPVEAWFPMTFVYRR
jgi:hypothetical protein